MRQLHTWLAMTVLLPAICPVPAVAEQWLISGAHATLWDFTKGAGAAINPRTITPGLGSQVTGIDFAADGTLFVATTVSGNSLYTVDPVTGAQTLVGPTGLTATIEGDIGFDATTGVLYGLYSLGSPSKALFTLNTTNGSATIIGPFAGDDPSGLAFDNTGQLWVIDSNVNTSHIPSLVKLDKTNGSVLSTQSIGLVIPSSGLGADFNPLTNQLYFATQNGNFYSVDTSTGLATLVDSHGIVDVAGLAFVVPEPASSTIMLLGLPAFAWLCKRMQHTQGT